MVSGEWWGKNANHRSTAGRVAVLIDDQGKCQPRADVEDSDVPSAAGGHHTFAFYLFTFAFRRRQAASKLLNPRFCFEHGCLHAPLDFHAAVLDGVAIGVGGNDDGFGNDACGRAERARHGETVPALGSPGSLERHARADDRQAGPAGEIGDALVDRPPRPARAVGRDAQVTPVDAQAHLPQRTDAAARGRARGPR